MFRSVLGVQKRKAAPRVKGSASKAAKKSDGNIVVKWITLEDASRAALYVEKTGGGSAAFSKPLADAIANVDERLSNFRPTVTDTATIRRVSRSNGAPMPKSPGSSYHWEAYVANFGAEAEDGEATDANMEAAVNVIKEIYATAALRFPVVVCSFNPVAHVARTPVPLDHVFTDNNVAKLLLVDYEDMANEAGQTIYEFLGEAADMFFTRYKGVYCQDAIALGWPDDVVKAVKVEPSPPRAPAAAGGDGGDGGGDPPAAGGGEVPAADANV